MRWDDERADLASFMRSLIRYFFRGLLVFVPIAGTIWIVTTVFAWIDGLVQGLVGKQLSVRIPGTDWEWRHGVGLALTILLITLIGILTANVFIKWILRRIEQLFQRLPVIKQIYTSIKDMIEAFVSERKKFDKPVLLSFGDSREVEVIGFVTRESLSDLGRKEKVAVYVPQSYNFAANLILVPHERVQPIDLPAADVMTFVVSGGVSGAEGSQEFVDPDHA